MLRVLSLGAGVQSSTMALMATVGEIEPMPDAAIFADTGWEPKAVYNHLNWLCSGVLAFPVHRVQRGNIRHDLSGLHEHGKTRLQGRGIPVPYFVKTERPGGGRLQRQCTKHYKLEPIRVKLRELMGLKPGQRVGKRKVEVWIGISTDEIMRVKPAHEPWITRRWPLIEKEMSRWDCLRWLEDFKFPKPPKSACIGCPYHNNAMWREMKMDRPEEFADAVEVDGFIRNGLPTSREGLYVHRSLKPLKDVDFRNLEDRGQLNLFNEECEGMCGV